MVFFGLCSLPFSGKKSLVELLCREYSFKAIKIDNNMDNSNHDEIEENLSYCERNVIKFPDLNSLMDYVTGHWREDFVYSSQIDEIILKKFMKRPFFRLLHVERPILARFNWSNWTDLNEFIALDDEIMYGDTKFNLSKLLNECKITIINDTANPRDMMLSLNFLGLNCLKLKLNLTRPDWDAYFMRLAHFASLRSNCMKRGVGAILVKDFKITATGYNGTASKLRNCCEGGCPRCNTSSIKCGQLLDNCLCLHAEESALLEAGRIRAEGCTLYCTMAPCLGCAKKICQLGLTRVVFGMDYSIEHFSHQLFSESGISCEKFEGFPETLKVSTKDLVIREKQNYLII